MKRKLLSTIMTLCIALMLMTVSAMADGDVAKIDDTGYDTLQEAVTAAADGGTVTLLADTTEDVTISKNIILDLGGKTLTGTGATNTAALTIATGATATVQNGTVLGTANSYYTIQNNGTATFETVTAIAGNTGSSMLDNWGTLTIESGTYTGGMDTVKNEPGAKLAISGGEFTLTKGNSNGFTAVVFNYGELNISGGTFTQSDASAPYGQAQVIHTDKSGSNAPKTTITGGSYTNKCTKTTAWTVRETNAAVDSTEVTGGNFNKKVSAGYLADGYTQILVNGMYATNQFVAKIGSTGYTSLSKAINKANESTSAETITLLQDVTVDHQIVIENANSKAITLDLGGFTLTSTYAIDTSIKNGSYALANNTPLTVKKGTFAAGQARAIGAFAALTLNGATVSQTLTGGHACVAFCKDGQTYKIENSTINGAYAVCNFANNATITISDSKLIGTGNTLYHNGTNYGLKLMVTNTEITSSGSCGVYISGSTSAQSNEANQNGEGGHQQATFTGCTISGTNGVEVKYTDLTLDGCNVEATVKTPSYTQNNNGPAGEGFAVVATDNAKNGVTPVPTGTVSITGNGKYTGPVGLGSLESVKTDYTDFKDETIAISGGTFDYKVPEDYCADGFVPKKNADGSYTVEAYKPVHITTGYNGTTVEMYDTLAEAQANLGTTYTWITIKGDYTLTENFTISEGVYLDVAKDATLTVAGNVTLTVAKNAKRLGVLTGGELEIIGTVMVCGTDYNNGKVMLQDGCTLTGKLSVPEGYFLDHNGNNYYATKNSKALFEAAYSDGSTVKSSELPNLTGATKLTLLQDATDYAGSISGKVAEGFILDLGGHTMTGKTTSTTVLSISVPMTIQNGTIGNVSTKTDDKGNATSGALMTLADVTIASNAIIDGGAGYAIWTDGYGHTLTVNGTVKCDGNYAITGNGSVIGGEIADCDITVNAGATISAPNGIAIYHPEKGTVTINGGTITGHTGIEMCAGKLIVSGGSITSNGTNWNATGSQNAILDGAAISIINRNYPGGVPTAEIKGGTIKTTGTGLTVKAYDYTGNEAAEWTEAGSNVNISGGTFSSIPDNMAALCASGYTATKNTDGSYGVRRVSSSSSSSGSSTSAITTPSKTENGTVTVSPRYADKGDTVTVTVKPDSGYVLDDLTVTDKNGNKLTLTDKGDGKYTFTMPAGRVEVKASFTKEIETSPFADVATDAYYYEAVKWAVKNGITDGVGNNLFAPGQPCTRAQIVTFLWRAAGSPEPKGTAAGMTDVVSGSYYEKAVAWAIENGVTTGTTATTFSPDATCTRAQAVTFLARALNAKAASAAEFSDVPTDSYFANAVAWAAANGVTEGVGNGMFAPDNDCTRGQIVTFLYRAYNK